MGFTGTADLDGVPGIYLSGFNVSGATAATPSFGRAQGPDRKHRQSVPDARRHEFPEGEARDQLWRGHQLCPHSPGKLELLFTRRCVLNPIYTANSRLTIQDSWRQCQAPAAPSPTSCWACRRTVTVTSMPRTNFRWTAVTPYLQDTWRILPNLTLNAGLGWNVSTPPNAVGPNKNYPHAFDFKTGQVKFAALGDISPRGLQHRSQQLRSPCRASLAAWLPARNDYQGWRGGSTIPRRCDL